MQQQKVEEIKQKLEHNSNKFIQKSLDCLSSIINIYQSPIYISFNGGKDATVVLHLIMIWMELNPAYKQKVKAIYLIEPDSFQEVDQFIEEMVSMYDLELVRIEKNYQVMKEYMEQQNIQNIIMGTRRSDPYSSNLLTYSPSDPQYGRFMRILPILDWNYHQVWDFLLSFDLEYCPLYQQGYTYLGYKNNTTRNSSLETQDGQYRHAKYCEDIDEHFSRFGGQNRMEKEVVNVMVIAKYVNNHKYRLVVDHVNSVIKSRVNNLVVIGEQESEDVQMKGEWTVFIEECIYGTYQEKYADAIRMTI